MRLAHMPLRALRGLTAITQGCFAAGSLSVRADRKSAKPLRKGSALLWLVAGSVALQAARLLAQGEGIQPAGDRPQPKPPAESAKCVRLPQGLRLELVAAEPQLREPAAICFDEHGRLFVGEIHGYNLDGYLDIVELNKTGQLDRQVRRVRHASAESQVAAKLQTYGTVRMLADTDGDGRMDQSVVWADRLPPCYGLVAARGGVIAVGAPDIVFLADRDGDGQCDTRETLFHGFNRELIERGTSNPRWSPDNWIYVAAGGGGGEISGPKLPAPVHIGHTDYRIKPDGTAIEPVTGAESMFGLTMTDFGDRFHTIVTMVVPLPYKYLARNPFIPSPAGDVAILPYRQIYPISQPDPWRLQRGQDPEWIKFYGEAETKPNGNFTASSGQMIYRADALPEAYWNNYFVCDPANNLIHRCLLNREGSVYTARRAPGEEQSEFLASTDQWFRPINLSIGPEGAIYIVDMYREIIEDFSAIPRFLQQQYAESLIAGARHGRIWRIVPEVWQDTASGTRQSGDKGPAEVRRRLAHIDNLTTAELAGLLDNSNHWWRETAQRLLIARADNDARAHLLTVLHRSDQPKGQLHALYTLDGLSMLRPEDVAAALASQSWGVRVHALQLGERWLDSDEAVRARSLAMIADPDARVRLQAGLSLGESRRAEAIAALARLAVACGDERWMAAAIASSPPDRAVELVTRLLATASDQQADVSSPAKSNGLVAVLGSLAETIAARRDEANLARVLTQVADLVDLAEAQQAVLEGVIRGLTRGDRHTATSALLVQAIERLLHSPREEISRRSIEVAGLLKLDDSPAMQAAWQTAVTTALDADRALPERLRGVSLLTVAPWSLQAKLAPLLSAREPTELQRAVVRALARTDHSSVAPLLLANWSGLLPTVQDQIVEALFARPSRLPPLLDALESGVVPPVSLGALRREQLIEHGETAIRDRARRLLAESGSDERAAVVNNYQSALSLPRDPKRGAEIFARTCARCHRLGDVGHDVGPNLLAARTRPDATLLVDVLDPSSALAHGYTAYTIVTGDGRAFTGLLASETATSITLRNAADADQAPRDKPSADSDPDGSKTRPDPGPVEHVILRREIEAMQASTKSLMPDGLERELSPQQLADLIGFLRQSLGPVIPPGKVLFDDEQSFVETLTQGAAKASLCSEDKLAGAVSLQLTAGQRHSSRIQGWNFRIVENPAGQSAENGYRYLRFAWKSAGADGVMFELADDGAWPPADKPLRRYYAGKNTSGWAAREVAAEAPADWATVTVDLWQDFGDFTLTGIAPTALGGTALFDRIELLRSLETVPPGGESN